ncbi:TAXI family TRAP transporter solute-binding subunit [Virgibacillus byunsanensis]|uniref:TAXI family TRAP transporter solute-binding subunit n=1 Tax=Virgibacillus byunsanensis TaxID=570945 RepID=A0ABW3LH54_9BACI
MKKQGLFWISMLATFFLLVGCQSDEAGSDEIGDVKMVTGDQAGSWITIGAGIADGANDYFEGFPITATPGPGSVGNPATVSTGEADIGMSYPPFLLEAKAGNEPFEEKMTNLRAVAALTQTVVHLYQNADMDAKSVEGLISDKTQMTLGVPPAGQGSNYISQIVFSSLGIEDAEKELEQWGASIYYGSGTDLVGGWKDRHVDAVMSTYNIPASAVEESLTAREGKIMDMGSSLVDILVEERGFTEFTIPSGTYTGQDNEVHTVSLPIVLFAREDTPDEVIYNLTKSIYENKESLEGVHNSFSNFNPENMATGLGIQVHSGAEEFYTEMGLMD